MINVDCVVPYLFEFRSQVTVYRSMVQYSILSDITKYGNPLIFFSYFGAGSVSLLRYYLILAPATSILISLYETFIAIISGYYAFSKIENTVYIKGSEIDKNIAIP